MHGLYLQNTQVHACDFYIVFIINLQVWRNNKMSAVKFRKDENELLQYTRDPQPQITASTKPRVLTIISNVDRTSREKVCVRACL